jgi:predicted N-acetyltransferase YhbS
MPIRYSDDHDLDLDEVIALYRASTLGERRPVDEREVMKGMLENADVIVTAWDGDRLVGISRALTDYTYVAYLADLAVHVDWQRRGIGAELIARTKRRLEPGCFITLLAAPKANDYYPKVGFEHNPRAWTWWPE